MLVCGDKPLAVISDMKVARELTFNIVTIHKDELLSDGVYSKTTDSGLMSARHIKELLVWR